MVRRNGPPSKRASKRPNHYRVPSLASSLSALSNHHRSTIALHQRSTSPSHKLVLSEATSERSAPDDKAPSRPLLTASTNAVFLQTDGYAPSPTARRHVLGARLRPPLSRSAAACVKSETLFPPIRQFLCIPKPTVSLRKTALPRTTTASSCILRRFPCIRGAEARCKATSNRTAFRVTPAMVRQRFTSCHSQSHLLDAYANDELESDALDGLGPDRLPQTSRQVFNQLKNSGNHHDGPSGACSPNPRCNPTYRRVRLLASATPIPRRRCRRPIRDLFKHSGFEGLSPDPTLLHAPGRRETHRRPRRPVFGQWLECGEAAVESLTRTSRGCYGSLPWVRHFPRKQQALTAFSPGPVRRPLRATTKTRCLTSAHESC